MAPMQKRGIQNANTLLFHQYPGAFMPHFKDKERIAFLLWVRIIPLSCRRAPLHRGYFEQPVFHGGGIRGLHLPKTESSSNIITGPRRKKHYSIRLLLPDPLVCVFPKRMESTISCVPVL